MYSGCYAYKDVMIFLHIQTLFALFSPSEQEDVVIKMEPTPRVMHLTSNNLINDTQKKQAKSSLKETSLRHQITKQKQEEKDIGRIWSCSCKLASFKTYCQKLKYCQS